MQIVAPDILAEAKGLSLSICIVGMLLGISLSTVGWIGNRFWVVLAATSAGGMYGLLAGPKHGMQPLVAGLTLAILCGVLSLPLIRFIIYAAAAVVAMFVVHLFFPKLDQPVLSLLIGGYLGIHLFRFWIMLLTSGVGSLLTLYSTLCLLDVLRKMDMVTWSQQKSSTLNAIFFSSVALGVLTQFLIDQWQQGNLAFKGKKKPADKKSDKPEKEAEQPKGLAMIWQQLRKVA